jgi:hypothetical protein
MGGMCSIATDLKLFKKLFSFSIFKKKQICGGAFSYHNALLSVRSDDSIIYSTTSPLHHLYYNPMVLFMNKITAALEKKEHVVAIFCDLRKTFDCCNHKILLQKLKNAGTKGKSLLWFFNYLDNRKQNVYVNGSKSSLLDI